MAKELLTIGGKEIDRPEIVRWVLEERLPQVKAGERYKRTGEILA